MKEFIFLYLIFNFMIAFSSNDQQEEKKSSFSCVREKTTIYLNALKCMHQNPHHYKNVRLIYNDPRITRFGAYQPIPDAKDSSESRWYPSFGKKTQGSAVTIEGNPIYYQMYMPEDMPLKGILFKIYGGKQYLDHYMFGVYSSTRVLASQGYGVVALTLSDMQDQRFPRQWDYQPHHIDQLIKEIGCFISDEFPKIKAPGYNHIKDVPYFLWGKSFGGLLTLICATSQDFLQKTSEVLTGFIADAPPTYQVEKNRKLFRKRSEIEKETFITHLSPILKVQNLTKPVLLMHGHFDMRVPLDHSLRFYKAACLAGKADIVSLWVNSQQVEHNSPSVSKEFLRQKIITDTTVRIMRKFIEQRKLFGSEFFFAYWNLAYPAPNNTDKLGSSGTPLEDTDDHYFYREAFSYFRRTPHNKNVDELLQFYKPSCSQKLNALKELYKKVETPAKYLQDSKEEEDNFKSIFYQELSKKIPLSIEVLKEKVNYAPFLYFDLSVHCIGFFLAEYSQIIHERYINTYIENFYTLFEYENPTTFRENVEKNAREKAIQQYKPHLEKFFHDYMKA